ncbi:MAG: NUDIX hydrolase N-terminal domain-containing protein [Planctomycetota bacterium]
MPDAIEKLMEWARELRAIGQTGLNYSENEYERERYERVRQIAADMLARCSTLEPGEAVDLDAADFAYLTPKVDVRGVIFRDDRVLLVREVADQGRWTVPGGWADVNDTPSEAVVREIAEESGYEARPVKLLAVYDREKQGHVPPFPCHVYKLFFECEITGGSPGTDHETSGVGFFDVDDLPELSVARVTEDQLRRFRRWRDGPDGRPADFD